MANVGVISDTHGLLRPEAADLLRGCDLILHAGDIGKPEVLDGLREIAPLEAIRGNVDRGEWALGLPERTTVRVAGTGVHLLHNLAELDLNAEATGIALVISGHSHQPGVTQTGSVTYLNPGSAGPRRFKLPVCLALVEITKGRVRAQIKNIEV